MSTDLVNLTILDLGTRLQSIAGMSNRVFTGMDNDDITDKLRGMKVPVIGLVYEGLRPFSSSQSMHGAVSSAVRQQGISAELVVSAILVTAQDRFGVLDSAFPAVALLDSMRKAVIQERSPTGHFWKFLLEAAGAQQGGFIFWVQRWSTACQLAVPGK